MDRQAVEIPKIIYNSIIPKLASWFFPVAAITIGPFVFVRRSRANPYLINHESIHVAQGRELYYLGFWALYFYYFFRGVFKFGPFEAYKSIPFEREAYANQTDLEYLNKRKPQGWKSYRI